ncbi:hypothetical protein SAMN06265365_1517 [Tistlia consotensis]|uniref:YCII-related domain-containing protein n=1 Tax=Tistlia consotensis USBA 355 TaxID=560819 RepID=A0A1Y6CRS6_9PROT|nr:YciI family protein [Tistlia consotensis]SMF83752.1 hypothetical protein SAMN05428998_1517 [Tistlia consotensis USBA 355]SNS34249.1 hypothetical protein SAMN06265365_1517 [Tistlia consotensis]
MLFALICTDKPGSLSIRLENRPAHLAYLESFADQIAFAGPLVDAEDKPNGSLIVIEVPDRNAAENFAAGDPYARAGLFSKVEIRHTKQVFPKIHA